MFFDFKLRSCGFLSSGKCRQYVLGDVFGPLEGIPSPHTDIENIDAGIRKWLHLFDAGIGIAEHGPALDDVFRYGHGVVAIFKPFHILIGRLQIRIDIDARGIDAGDRIRRDLFSLTMPRHG